LSLAWVRCANHEEVLNYYITFHVYKFALNILYIYTAVKVSMIRT